MNNCKAVIAAAGMSSRMGAFKPLLRLGNGTFISNILDTFKTAGISEFIIVTGNQADELRKSLACSDVTFIHNPAYAETDMFASVKLGLAAAGASDILFTTADSPVFTALTVAAIMERAEKTPCEAIIPSYKGNYGHPVFIRKKLTSGILAFSGIGGLRAALALAGGKKAILDLPDPGICMDADTPEDYARIFDYYEKLITQTP